MQMAQSGCGCQAINVQTKSVPVGFQETGLVGLARPQDWGPASKDAWIPGLQGGSETQRIALASAQNAGMGRFGIGGPVAARQGWGWPSRTPGDPQRTGQCPWSNMVARGMLTGDAEQEHDPTPKMQPCQDNKWRRTRKENHSGSVTEKTPWTPSTTLLARFDSIRRLSG
jgi:hypothetical protein